MKTRDAVTIGAAVAMLAAAGVLLAVRLARPAPDTAEDTTCWLCTNAPCGAEFTSSALEIARLRRSNPDANPVCPRCGKATTIRSVPCPHCGKFLRPAAHGQLPKTCPGCGQATVEPAGGP